ncbi:MAG: hypothetical protein ABWK01_03300 [Infirmifilum sp.]
MASESGLLGRRDPDGFYVILAKKEAVKILPRGISFIPDGDRLVLRVKSRSEASRILRLLIREGLLYPEK